MIALSLFDATKDFFHRWVSTTISYAFYPIVITAMFSTVVGMANSLLAQLGGANSATNIGSLVPFFVMVFLAKGFFAATPLIVRGLFNTDGVKGRARIGALTAGEMIGRGAVQTSAALRSVATTASGRVVRMAERAKRLTAW